MYAATRDPNNAQDHGRLTLDGVQTIGSCFRAVLTGSVGLPFSGIFVGEMRVQMRSSRWPSQAWKTCLSSLCLTLLEASLAESARKSFEQVFPSVLVSWQMQDRW